MENAARGVVLVEGESDRRAVAALAARRGVDGSSYTVVAMGGVTNLGRHLRELGPDALVAGLYDAGEEQVVLRALAAAGYGHGLDRWDLAALGFFACEADLEDELIRALGVTGVLAVVEQQRDLGSFYHLTTQLAYRDRDPTEQLHRFFGSGSGRKIRYAPLVVQALAEDAVPAPLADLVEHIRRWRSP